LTVKKAIKIIDWWIDYKRQTMKELKEKWNYPSDPLSETTTMLFKLDETIINNLQKIKDQLIPKCKHPKKMQDTCDGQKYCMNCNWDL